MQPTNLRRLLPAALLIAACSSQTTNTPNPSTGSGEPGPGDVPGPAVENTKQPATVGRFDIAAAKPMAYPVRIDTAANGTVFVTDTAGNQVLGFRDGHVVTALVGLDAPLGLAVSNDLLYVGNVGRKDVEVYSLTESRFVRTIGGEGAFEMPNAIAVAKDGTVYVVDSRRDVVEVFGADGSAREDIGGTGSLDGQFRFPSDVAVDDERVVVGDQGNHRVQMFDREGTFVRAFGSELENARTTDDLRGKFTSIGGVELRGDEILAVDSVHAYVQVFDLNGESKGTFGRAGTCGSCTKMPLDVTVDSEGRVLATDPEQRRWVALSTEMR